MNTWLFFIWETLPLALAHTLWQGALAACVLWLALRRLPGAQAERRYNFAAAALAGVVILWLLTWSILLYEPPAPPPSAVPPRAELPAPVDSAPVLSMVTSPALRVPIAWQVWLGRVWLVGFSCMLARMIFLLRGAGRLRHGALHCTDTGATGLLDELRRELRVTRNVGLYVADHVPGPLVVGALWPVILLPPFVLTGLPPDQLRAVLAHELAHIRRHDYLVNLLQLFLESLLFFNPSVWWISAQLRAEREACCDALVIRAGTPPARYARLLAEFAAPPAASTAAALGARSESGLLNRVRRILLPEARPALRLPWYSLAGVLAVSALLLGSLGGGAYFAVVVFARAMSPEERIEKMAEIRRQLTVKQYPEDMVSVSGRVVWDSKKPMPGQLRIHSETHYSYLDSSLEVHSSVSNACSVVDGAFRISIHPGLSYLTLVADDTGDSLAIHGPIELVSDPGPDLLLRVADTPPVRFLVRDPQGKPLRGVNVKWRYYLEVGNVATYARGGKAVSDPDGVIEFALRWNGPVELTTDLPGFQKWRETLAHLTAGEERILTLAPAQLLVLPVRDKRTGAPVKDARLYLIQSYGKDEGGWGDKLRAEDNRLLGISDEAGVIRLDTLVDGTRYRCWVGAPGLGKEMIELYPGMPATQVQLDLPLQVHGVVNAPLSWNGPRNLYFRSWNLDPHRLNELDDGEFEVILKDGRGDFTLENIWPGNLEIRGGVKPVNFKIKESVDDVAVQLAETEDVATIPRREVLLRFVAPEGAPKPSGTVVLQCHPRDGQYIREVLTVQDGEARYAVPVPCSVTAQMDLLQGYWTENTSDTAVTPGDEPFVIEIPAHPAGLIHGTLSGAPESYQHVGVIVVDKAQKIEWPHIRSDAHVEGDRYAAGPLPIGGRYALLAVSGNAVVLSPEMHITNNSPIQELPLAFVPGVTVSGRALLPDGSPAAGLSVELLLETRYSHTHGLGPVYTTSAGAFEFPHVNPDLPVTYALQIILILFQVETKYGMLWSWQDQLPSTKSLCRKLKPLSHRQRICKSYGKLNLSFSPHCMEPRWSKRHPCWA